MGSLGLGKGGAWWVEGRTIAIGGVCAVLVEEGAGKQEFGVREREEGKEGSTGVVL